MKRPVLPGSPPLTFRAAPPRNKERHFPLISPFESHRGQSLKCSATFLATLLQYLPEAPGGSGQGSREETSLAAKLAVGTGWPTGCFIPPGCPSRLPQGLQGGQSNACGEGRKEPQSIAESVALTDARRVPEPGPAAPRQQYMPPPGSAAARGGVCPILHFTCFPPRRDGTWRSGARAASLLPGGKGKRKAASACAAVSARGAACHESRSGWRGGWERQVSLRGVSFHTLFCATRA